MLARHDRRARDAPLLHRPDQPQVEPGLRLGLLAVAVEAVGLEDRPDVALEARRRSPARVGRRRPAPGRRGGRLSGTVADGTSRAPACGGTLRGLDHLIPSIGTARLLNNNPTSLRRARGYAAPRAPAALVIVLAFLADLAIYAISRCTWLCTFETIDGSPWRRGDSPGSPRPRLASGPLSDGRSGTPPCAISGQSSSSGGTHRAVRPPAVRRWGSAASAPPVGDSSTHQHT